MTSREHHPFSTETPASVGPNLVAFPKLYQIQGPFPKHRDSVPKKINLSRPRLSPHPFFPQSFLLFSSLLVFDSLVREGSKAMASRYEVEVTIGSARDLKNVNWRHGDLRPYTVVWIDPNSKCSTKAAFDGDVNPEWDEKLVLALPSGQSLDDAVIYIDIVHAGTADDVKPLVGSARLPLREVLDDAGIGGKASRTLKLKRPSGRPQGRLDVKVAVKEPSRYYDPYAPPYGQRSTASRDYQYGYAQPYAAAPPPAGYPYSAPPPPAGAGYSYGAPQPAYGAPQPAYGAPQPAYGAPPVYGQGSYGAAQPVVVEEKKKSKFGMGTGLAVGAAAGVLGGLALAEGIDYVEDKIADNAAERVEDDLAYDGGYDDF